MCPLTDWVRNEVKAIVWKSTIIPALFHRFGM